MTVLAKGLGRNVNQLTRKVALAADQALVLGTPVDTGRARSNWQVSLGQPAAGERDPYAAGQALGINEGANAQAAIAQGAGVIGSRSEGQSVFISNNLPYIERLNDGWSAQAPAGFVEDAVLKAAEAVNDASISILDVRDTR